MDHAQLLFGEAEGGPVSQVLEGGQLIHHDQVCVLKLDVDAVEVLAQERLRHGVMASLLEIHVHHTA